MRVKIDVRGMFARAGGEGARAGIGPVEPAFTPGVDKTGYPAVRTCGTGLRVSSALCR